MNDEVVKGTKQKDMNSFKAEREENWLIAPFQCELCCFWNLRVHRCD